MFQSFFELNYYVESISKIRTFDIFGEDATIALFAIQQNVKSYEWNTRTSVLNKCTFCA